MEYGPVVMSLWSDFRESANVNWRPISRKQRNRIRAPDIIKIPPRIKVGVIRMGEVDVGLIWRNERICVEIGCAGRWCARMTAISITLKSQYIIYFLYFSDEVM